MIYDTEYHCLRIFIQGTWNCLYETGALAENQMQVTGWSSTPLDEGYDTDIDIDSDENIYTTTDTEDGEIRLAKYDNKGNLEWSIFEYAANLFSVDVDQNGTAFTVGSRFIKKTSSDGLTSHVVSLDKSIHDPTTGLDQSDNFLMAYSEVYVQPDIFRLDKYDNNLNLLWSTHLDNLLDVNLYHMDIDSNGDIYLAVGYTEGAPVNNIFNDDIQANNIYVAKFDGVNGTLIWERNISNPLELKVDNIIKSGDDVFVIGSYDNVSPYNTGKTFFTQRYGQGPGQTKLYKETDRLLIIVGSDISHSDQEICMSVIEILNGKYEFKLLFMSLQSQEIEYEKDLAFRTGGPIVYNFDENRIYGIGTGDQAGNTVIESTGDQNENNIIFKVQKD